MLPLEIVHWRTQTPASTLTRDPINSQDKSSLSTSTPSIVLDMAQCSSGLYSAGIPLHHPNAPTPRVRSRQLHTQNASCSAAVVYSVFILYIFLCFVVVCCTYFGAISHPVEAVTLHFVFSGPCYINVRLWTTFPGYF